MRKFLSGILAIILSILVCALIFSFYASKICVDTLSSTVVNKQIASKTIDVVKEKYPKISNNTLQKIETAVKNSDEINKITEIYFNAVIDNYGKGNAAEVPDIKVHVKRLITESASFLTDEQINDVVKTIDEENKFNGVYEWVLNNLTDDQKEAISLYKFVISDKFKIIVGISIVITIILIMILLKSLYKWMLNVSLSSILSGLTILLLIPKLLNTISKKMMTSLIGSTSTININAVNNYGYLLLLIGVVLLGFYILFTILSKKKAH